MEIELSDYEHGRLRELNTTLGNLVDAARGLEDKLRQMQTLKLELMGRRSELLEMLGSKYQFDPGQQVELAGKNKLTVKGGKDNGQRDTKTLGASHKPANTRKGRLSG